ncbi:MAG: YitT family protein [Ruminococcaceae bacterium]|nr:YitT family protein [Oscillospiraceae bacterium]
MNTKKENIRYLLGKIIFLIAGSILYGLAVNMFISPGGITMGGFTGISTTLNRLFSTPVGFMIILLNIPVFALEVRTGGGRLGLINAILGVVGTSVATDALSALPYTHSDSLLSCVFGGLLLGAGTGLLLSKGYTTGGSDLIAHILHRRFPFLSTGKLILFIDASIVLLCSGVLGTGWGILFSFAALWCFSTALDSVLDGFGGSKLVMIISDRYEEIADRITLRLKRGVTVLSGKGWYTGREKKVLFCAVKRGEIFALTELVRRTDRGAFVTVCDAHDVLGEGFRKM